MVNKMDYHENTYIAKSYNVNDLEGATKSIDDFLNFKLDTDNFNIELYKGTIKHDTLEKIKEIIKSKSSFNKIILTLTVVFDSIIVMVNINYTANPGSEYTKDNVYSLIFRIPQKVETGGWGTYFNNPVDEVGIIRDNKLVAKFNVYGYQVYD